jgi:hypothetical protein
MASAFGFSPDSVRMAAGDAFGAVIRVGDFDHEQDQDQPGT